MAKVEQIFSCTRCGYCCHGETTVSLDEGDQQRMVEVLGGDRDSVARAYWRVTGNVVQMKVRNSHCIFYEDGCMVHLGRPWRCAQWPLHPSILTDENNFRTISESCPGINKEISYKDFCAILEKLMQDGTIVC